MELEEPGTSVWERDQVDASRSWQPTHLEGQVGRSLHGVPVKNAVGIAFPQRTRLPRPAPAVVRTLSHGSRSRRPYEHLPLNSIITLPHERLSTAEGQGALDSDDSGSRLSS